MIALHHQRTNISHTKPDVGLFIKNEWAAKSRQSLGRISYTTQEGLKCTHSMSDKQRIEIRIKAERHCTYGGFESGCLPFAKAAMIVVACNDRSIKLRRPMSTS